MHNLFQPINSDAYIFNVELAVYFIASCLGTDEIETGFYQGASNRVLEMLYFKDIYTRK